MPTLTNEALNENPRAVLTDELPAKPSLLLLLNAQIAATCLRQMASETLDDFDRTWTNVDEAHPGQDAALDQWFFANKKIGEVIHLLELMFGVPEFDFWLRRKPQPPTISDLCKSIIEKLFW